MSNLNFSAGAAASLRQAQATGGVKPAAAPTPAQQAAPAATPTAARPVGRPSPPVAPVHMAAEEMDRHIDEALEKSPVLKDEEAPLIDLAHLDAPPETDGPEAEDELPEAEGDDFEPVEFEAVETAEEEDYEPADEDPDEGGGEVSRETYLAEELKIYQQDREQPAKRQAHLLKDQQGNDKPGAAALAVACEGAVGGLGRTLAVMPGDFVGLAGAWTGISFGVLALTNPNQLQPFVQELRKALARPELEYFPLDLARVPASHQGYVLKTLPSCGAKPQHLLIWLGQGKRQWNS